MSYTKQVIKLGSSIDRKLSKFAFFTADLAELFKAIMDSWERAERVNPYGELTELEKQVLELRAQYDGFKSKLDKVNRSGRGGVTAEQYDRAKSQLDDLGAQIRYLENIILERRKSSSSSSSTSSPQGTKPKPKGGRGDGVYGFKPLEQIVTNPTPGEKDFYYRLIRCKNDEEANAVEAARWKKLESDKSLGGAVHGDPSYHFKRFYDRHQAIMGSYWRKMQGWKE